ncbi:MAG: LLM class flavin-dependent oxidoreductase [Candidatus Rokuibacteriota bacterium]
MTPDGPVKFAIALPQTFSRPQMDVGLLRSFLGRVEGLGYDSIWVQEQMVGAAGSLEPVTLLAYAAALTRTVRLGTAVLLTPLRSPVPLAKSLATLDQLSSGRLIAGVGLGANTRIYPAFGYTPERRVRRFVEGLELLKRLWTEERVTFAGEFWKLENAPVMPKPVQKPHPPLWFGARHPEALRRAVALGDGFIGAGSASTAEFREQVGHVHRFLREAKRDPASFPVAKRVYLLVDPDTSRARERLREWFGWFYGQPALADRVPVIGGVAECIEGLREVRAAGAGLILLNPVFDEAEVVERYARELVPEVAR